MRTDTVALIARLLMSVIFLISGIGKLAGWGGMLAYVASKGLPLPAVALAIATIIEIAGGIMLILGAEIRLAAWILFLYLIPTTLIFHAFWAAPAAQRSLQMINFLKNLAIMGGLLEVAAFGAGYWSIDRLTAGHGLRPVTA